MKCYQCDTILPENETVCPHCGADQGISAELVYRAKINDQQALTELYNKTKDSVYYTIKALVKDEDTVLDILQDSYVKAFISLSQLESHDKFRPWIKRIAHNRAIDHLRVKRPVLFSEIENEDSDMPLEFEDDYRGSLPDVVIDQAETKRLMSEILDTLPDEQRAVISMHYYEEIPVRDIAAELGVSEGTVKSRLNYGRKKVEAKVRALEKQGIKLYGLTPIPFFRLVLRSLENCRADIAKKAVSSILSAKDAEISAAALAAVSAGSKTATASAAAKFNLFNILKASVAARVIAGVAAVTLVTGGITTAATLSNSYNSGGRDKRIGGGTSAAATSPYTEFNPAQNAAAPTTANRTGTGSGSGQALPQGQNATTAAPAQENNDTPVSSAPVNDNDTDDAQGSSSQSTPKATQKEDSSSEKLGATYTDPKGIITFTVPQAWQDYCTIDTETENAFYKINIRMKKLYNDETVLQEIVCLNVYDKTSNVQHGLTDPIASNSRYAVYKSAFGQPPNLSSEEQSANSCVNEALNTVKIIAG